MNILYLTTSKEDYLQDQILIGLRKKFGNQLVDYPKKEVMYKNCQKDKVYGNGFTIWKLLDDIVVNRDNIQERLSHNEFDIIIFSSIWRQTDLFQTFLSKGFFKNKIQSFIFLDGEDHNKIFYRSLFYGKYFKREKVQSILGLFTNEFSFSIPHEKLIPKFIKKRKKFAKHVQCAEAYKIHEIRESCQSQYAFQDEAAYYQDIAESQYAITMKKGGWECMRHYEIAANATIPCFYQFEKKPVNCAPHGLKDMYNVVSFNSAEELEEKVLYIEQNGLYEQIQKQSFQWAEKNTCENRAKSLFL